MRGHACGGLRRAVAGVFLAAFVALGPGVGLAATVPQAEIEARREQLFQQMLAQPDNLDIAFEYASLSVEAGDLEAAISTLERMLIYAPGLPRIQLELGVLYYRLGSYETARGYFEGATNGTAPPEVIDKVKIYFDAIDRALNPTTLTTSLYTGLRWQSNANSAPTTNIVVLNGLPFELGNDATGKSDFSWFATGGVLYSLDLQNQGDRFEVEAVGYNAFYFDQTHLDTNLIETRIGPNFNMGRFGLDDSYLGVYGIGGGVLLGHTTYYAAAGAGVKLATQPTLQTEVFTRLEYRHRWYDSSSEHPNASDRTGNVFSGVTAFRYIFSPTISATIGGQFAREDTRVDYLANWEYGVYGQVNLTFDGPGFMPQYPWAANINGGYLHRDYDDPDPAINVNASERDDEYWIMGTLNMPVTQNIAIMPQVEYRKLDSNYPTRRYDSFTAMLGVYLVY